MLPSSFLARNTLLNLVGLALPALVALLATPLSIRLLGIERYGFLGLAMVVLSYATLFDLGLSRAATKYAAEAVGAGGSGRVERIFWTTLLSQVVLGIAGGLLVWGAAPLLLPLLKVSSELIPEARLTLSLLALLVPIVLASGVFFALLEASQRFGWVNLIRTPLGVLGYITPVLAGYLGWGMPGVIWLQLALRAGALLALALACYRQFPQIRQPAFQIAELRRLGRFGRWVLVSNVVGPLLVYIERFLLASLISVTAAGYYQLPFSLITQLWIIPASFQSVLFPAFSQLNSQREVVATLQARALRMILAAIGLVVVGLWIFAYDLLRIWVGAELAQQSTLALQILSLGLLVNSLAHVPFAFIQARGRPDITAKFHLLELPLHLTLTYFLVKAWGIPGAALAWTTRVSLDTFLLFATTYRIDKSFWQALREQRAGWSALMLLLYAFGFGFLAHSLASYWLLLPMTVTGVALFGYGFLTSEERDWVWKRFERPLPPAPSPKGSTQDICAVIVTYNPSKELLGNVEALRPQVSEVVIVDNASQQGREHLDACNQIPGVRVLGNSENVGVAVALNIGANYALAKGYVWLATFDQDSRVTPNYMNHLMTTLGEYPHPERVGLLSPLYVNEAWSRPVSMGSRLERVVTRLRGRPFLRIRSTWTSGNLVRLQAIAQAGDFREEFFMDYIDHEFCMRLGRKGFAVVESWRAQLLHRLGEPEVRDLGFTRLVLTHHSALRRYYRARNALTIYREYFLDAPFWVLRDFRILVRDTIKAMLFEPGRADKLHMTLVAIRDAYKRKYGKWHG